MTLSKRYSGITLLETTVYLAMFAVLFTVMIQFYFTIGSSNRHSDTALSYQRSRIFLAQHTSETIRKSQSYDSANSTEDDDDGVLRLTQNSGYKEYYIQNNGLYITDGTDSFRLTPVGFDVTKFRIEASQDSGGKMYYLDILIELNDPEFPNFKETIDLYYVIKA